MIGTIINSGQICIISGIWKVQGAPSTAIRIIEGELMPKFRGNEVSWRLIQHCPK